MFRDDLIFILDVDGILSPNFFYNKKGKYLKEFGNCDWDALRELMQFIKIIFITADRKGYNIVKKRIVDEMKWELFIVPHKPKERWQWMREEYKDKKIIFMGDGIYDYYSLDRSHYSITVPEALDHVKECINYVTKRSAGRKAVAEACMHLMKVFNFDWESQYET